MPLSGSQVSSVSRRTSGLTRLAGKRRTSTTSPTDAPVSRAASRARSSAPWPTVNRGIEPVYPAADSRVRAGHARGPGQRGPVGEGRSGVVESGARASLWRSPALRALVAATALGFASYCLTLASLPAYAVTGGAAANSAGLVTTVLLVVTIAV